MQKRLGTGCSPSPSLRWNRNTKTFTAHPRTPFRLLWTYSPPLPSLHTLTLFPCPDFKSVQCSVNDMRFPVCLSPGPSWAPWHFPHISQVALFPRLPACEVPPGCNLPATTCVAPLFISTLYLHVLYFCDSLFSLSLSIHVF